MGITWVAVAGAFLLASYIKGTTGMGFPLIATPMVAMLVDIRTTYALLLMPNILMDVFQIGRAELPWPLWRRLAPLLGTTVIGVFLGTRIMIAIPERAILLLALQFDKRDFVKGIASMFLVAKVSQLVAIARWGLYTPAILQWSAGLTAVALGAFWVGLKTQDRVHLSLA